ncbi:MAG: amino acid racemase [Rhodothermales bacterium]
MNERNAIGVIGGLGPYAGLDLVKKVFDNTVAAADQEHLPVALISYPGHFPDRSTYIADQSKPNPVPALAEVLRRLHDAGCSVAGMPCNTAHAPVIFDVLRETMAAEGRAIDLLNMIDACADVARERGARRVGILATNSSLRNRLHSDALERIGLEAVDPEWDFQNEVINPVIFDPVWGIKAQSDPPTERAREHLLRGIRHLRERGADAVILGCTELPLAVPEASFEGLPLIDSTETLARALIRATHPAKLRPLADAVAEKGDVSAEDH